MNIPNFSKIELRKDGAFGIICPDDGIEYHIYNQPDQYNRYPYQEVKDYAEAHPELCVPEPEPTATEILDAKKDCYCKRIESTVFANLSSGFKFGQNTFQADLQAQQSANGILTAITAGVSSPIGFFSKDNQWVSMTTSEFKSFSGAMILFVNSTYQDNWSKKSAIRACTTIEELESLMASYE